MTAPSQAKQLSVLRHECTLTKQLEPHRLHGGARRMSKSFKASEENNA